MRKEGESQFNESREGKKERCSKKNFFPPSGVIIREERRRKD